MAKELNEALKEINCLELDEIMSDGYGIVSRKVMRAEFLTPNAKALYSYICSFAGSGNCAFPSTETIKRELSFCKDVFYAARRELESYGIIEVETTYTRAGARTVYKLLSSARVTPEALEAHMKTEAVRASKAEKANKARQAIQKGTKKTNQPKPEETKLEADEAKICDAPEGFEELRRISLKQVKPDEHEKTLDAYNKAILKGYDPEDIKVAYETYIKRYKNEHPETIRFAKQLHAYLTQPDGLAFDARPSKGKKAVIVEAPERSEERKRAIEQEQLDLELTANSEAYRNLTAEYESEIHDAMQCTKQKNDEGYRAHRMRADEVYAAMCQMQQDFKQEKGMGHGVQ